MRHTGSVTVVDGEVHEGMVKYASNGRKFKRVKRAHKATSCILAPTHWHSHYYSLRSNLEHTVRSRKPKTTALHSTLIRINNHHHISSCLPTH